MDKLEHIFNEIEKGRIGIFFGAGMSFNSGLPTVKTITGNILKSLNLEKYTDQIIKLEYPFELFMEDLSKYIEIDNFLDIFKEGNPNHFHQLVCDLIDNGLVKDIMTTNFDLLIEKTRLKHNLSIIDRERKFKSITEEEDFINYIKIHGNVSNKQTIRTTMSQIFRKELRNSRKSILTHFFKNKELNYIIVLGYSCSDIIDISPIIEAIEESKTKILFVEHTNKKTFNLKDLKNHKLFSNFSGNWLVCDTDIFLERLHLRLFKTKLQTVRFNQNLEKYFRFANVDRGIPELVISNIFFKNSKFEIAKEILEDILSTETIDENTRADIYVPLLEIYNSLYSRKKDKHELLLSKNNYFEESIKIYEKSDNYFGIGQAFNHWGHILGTLRKFQEALQAYDNAEEYFYKAKNKYRIAQIQNNKGHISLELYKKTKDDLYFNNANKYFKDSFNYFSKSGKVFEYSISLFNLGCLYVLKPEKKHIALRHFESSLQFAKNIKDKDGIKLCNYEIKKAKKLQLPVHN